MIYGGQCEGRQVSIRDIDSMARSRCPYFLNSECEYVTRTNTWCKIKEANKGFLHFILKYSVTAGHWGKIRRPQLSVGCLSGDVYHRK